MKRRFALIIIVICGAVSLLYYFEYFHVELAPHNSYRLSSHEEEVISHAVQTYRDRVKEGSFDQIAEDLSNGRRDSYWEKIILEDIRKDSTEFGLPISWELFSCAQPQYDAKEKETVYHLDYLTRFAQQELYESIILVKKENNNVHMINADFGLLEAAEWRINERNRHRALRERYPRGLTIPYADRFLEIRF